MWIKQLRIYGGNNRPDGIDLLAGEVLRAYRVGFLTRDIWQGDLTRPLSQNSWNYVEGNLSTGLIHLESGTAKAGLFLGRPSAGAGSRMHWKNWRIQVRRVKGS